MKKDFSKEECQKFIDRAFELRKTSMTFEDIYRAIIGNNQSNKAAIYFDENKKIHSFDYKKYGERAVFFSKRLSVTFKNLSKGSVVALKMKNSPDWPLLFWAILMTGHPVLLIDFKLEKKNTENLLASSKAEAIIASETESYSVLTLGLNDVENGKEDESLVPSWADEALFCSSGTTGDIKIMVIKGRAMCEQIMSAKDIPLENLDLMHPGEIRTLAMLPFHHIFGFNVNLMWFNFFGKTLVYPNGRSAKDIMFASQKGKCTHVFSVPLLWDSLAKNLKNAMSEKSPKYETLLNKMIQYNFGEISKKEAGFASTSFFRNAIQKKLLGKHIRFCISGGGQLSFDTSRTINGIGYPLYNGFGMTEAGICSVELSTDIIKRVLCSIGKPLFGITYKIEEKEGELLIKGGTLHSEEIINGKRNNVTLEDGFLRTGDIASIDADGRVFLKGRLKDTIIGANGENIYPNEIENYFKEVKHVERLCAFGIKEEKTENIVVVLELDNSATTEDFSLIEEELNTINNSLPRSKKASHFYIYKSSIPLSNSMKPKRFAIRDDLAENPSNFIDISKRKNEVISIEGHDLV
ncbi:MAG: acyl--CoA ligase [Bacilli bacterium]|nr:acyl--CoA ligase [Bacilli bacterium]